MWYEPIDGWSWRLNWTRCEPYGVVPLEGNSHQYYAHGLLMGIWVLNNISRQVGHMNKQYREEHVSYQDQYGLLVLYRVHGKGDCLA